MILRLMFTLSFCVGALMADTMCMPVLHPDGVQVIEGCPELGNNIVSLATPTYGEVWLNDNPLGGPAAFPEAGDGDYNDLGFSYMLSATHDLTISILGGTSAWADVVYFGSTPITVNSGNLNLGIVPVGQTAYFTAMNGLNQTLYSNPALQNGYESFWISECDQPLTLTPAPEPVTFALCGLGLIGVGLFRFKRGK